MLVVRALLGVGDWTEAGGMCEALREREESYHYDFLKPGLDSLMKFIQGALMDPRPTTMNEQGSNFIGIKRIEGQFDLIILIQVLMVRALLGVGDWTEAGSMCEALRAREGEGATGPTRDHDLDSNPLP